MSALVAGRGSGKRVAVVQSNYIPWKGYFDLINYVDEFVLYDEVQYTRRDWRNRNLIKTPKGLEWITVPVEVKGNYYAPIRDIRLADPAWGRRHWAMLAHNYARAPFFRQYKDLLEPAFVEASETHLSTLNRRLLELLCGLLAIRTRLSWSSDYPTGGDRNERLLGLCKAAGASVYLSGPAAKGYLDEGMFVAEGIAVEWMGYSGYPEYPQLYGPFEHGVSVLDLLLNTGARAPQFMKSFAKRAG
jgi:WbqC-like protein family